MNETDTRESWDKLFTTAELTQITNYTRSADFMNQTTQGGGGAQQGIQIALSMDAYRALMNVAPCPGSMFVAVEKALSAWLNAGAPESINQERRDHSISVPIDIRLLRQTDGLTETRSEGCADAVAWFVEQDNVTG